MPRVYSANARVEKAIHRFDGRNSGRGRTNPPSRAGYELLDVIIRLGGLSDELQCSKQFRFLLRFNLKKLLNQLDRPKSVNGNGHANKKDLSLLRDCGARDKHSFVRLQQRGVVSADEPCADGYVYKRRNKYSVVQPPAWTLDKRRKVEPEYNKPVRLPVFPWARTERKQIVLPSHLPMIPMTWFMRYVWQRIACDVTTKGIALELGLSTKTVEYHRRLLYVALGTSSYIVLTRMAIKSGLVML